MPRSPRVGQITDIDFLEVQPRRTAAAHHEQGSLDKFAQWGTNKTLRQLASEIGTPEEVAERMGQAMEEIGGHGFLIGTPFQRISRRFINDVCEGLVPALQRRGLVRETYTRSTLREF